MKQLELEFVGVLKKFKRAEPEVIEVVTVIEDDQATPKGWKAGTLTSSTLVRKKSLKQLQKENMRITDWVKKPIVYEVDEKDKALEKETQVLREIEEQREVDK